MKKTILILGILIISIQFAIGQNYEPATHQFMYLGSPIYLSGSSANFQPRNFLLGWQWGGNRKITQSEDGTVVHGESGAFSDTSNMVNNSDIILIGYGGSHGAGGELLNGRGFQFEPTLTVNSENPAILNKRYGDITHPIFGFRTRTPDGIILTDSTEPNFSRFKVGGIGFSSQVILADPWPNTEIYQFDGGATPADPVYDEYLCRTMLISINLRREDLLGGLDGKDSLLKIELPYTFVWDSTYVRDTIPYDTIHVTKIGHNNIQFALIPSDTASSYINLPHSRGRYRNMITAPPNTREIVITRDMIPPGNIDITISASFTMYGFPPPSKDNPKLKQLSVAQMDRIDTIGIKVTYIDPKSKPLLIDWVRLETPNTHKLLSGYYDDDLISHTQKDLDSFSILKYTSKNIRIFRYNTITEGSIYNWIAERYFNKLIGNLGTGEVGNLYPELYEYYVNPPDRWVCTNFLISPVSAPYSWKIYGASGENSSKTLGIINGYSGITGYAGDGFNVETLYPNPTNGIININFHTDNLSLISIELDDLTGNKIANIFQGNLEQGNQSIPYNCSQLPNGIYFIKITSPTYSKTFKLIKEG